MSKKAEDTPMMKQYREARESLEEDTLLFFRLGDFYEMFEKDAERGAALLGITLTRSDTICPWLVFPIIRQMAI